jgi:hypothetical protein
MEEEENTQQLFARNFLSASQDGDGYSQLEPARKKRKVSVAVARIRVQPLPEVDESVVGKEGEGSE